jgi:hypothetical protein
MRPEDIPVDFVAWKDPEDTILTTVIRNILVKDKPALLSSLLIALISGRRDSLKHWYINAVEIIGHRGNRVLNNKSAIHSR